MGDLYSVYAVLCDKLAWCEPEPFGLTHAGFKG